MFDGRNELSLHQVVSVQLRVTAAESCLSAKIFLNNFCATPPHERMYNTSPPLSDPRSHLKLTASVNTYMMMTNFVATQI
jgi:hypothetical protein